jgi:chemotaxis protein methyltransferase CheR
MNNQDFEFVAAMLKETSGLALGPDKGYLLESRLGPIAKKYSCNSVDELIGRLRAGRLQEMVRDVVEAMTTNESFFFRDVKPFDAFRDKILPELMAHRAASRTLRIWCAAASTGQEPYSLAMILHEEASKLSGWTCDVLATDISKDVLTRAETGLYTQFEVQRGLTIQRLLTHFDKKDVNWQLKPDLRRKVRFRSFNLLDDPRSLGRFDIVYCRNVLIYFDQPTKARVLDSISQVMNDNGVLVLGGAETVFGISPSFKAWGEQHGLYCLAAPMAAPLSNTVRPLAMASAK